MYACLKWIKYDKHMLRQIPSRETDNFTRFAITPKDTHMLDGETKT